MWVLCVWVVMFYKIHSWQFLFIYLFVCYVNTLVCRYKYLTLCRLWDRNIVLCFICDGLVFVFPWGLFPLIKLTNLWLWLYLSVCLWVSVFKRYNQNYYEGCHRYIIFSDTIRVTDLWVCFQFNTTSDDCIIRTVQVKHFQATLREFLLSTSSGHLWTNVKTW